jgi:hypothetical protein
MLEAVLILTVTFVTTFRMDTDTLLIVYWLSKA